MTNFQHESRLLDEVNHAAGDCRRRTSTATGKHETSHPARPNWAWLSPGQFDWMDSNPLFAESL